MSVQALAPTRTNLLRARRRLERVRQATDLLSRKRRALVIELFRVARPAVDARERMAERAESAYAALLRAQAVQGESGLRALSWPERDLVVELRATRVWGVAAAELVEWTPLRRSASDREAVPGWTGPAAAAAASEFEELVELLLDAASRELLIRQIARALAATSRQLNVLEQRVAPRLEGETGRIRAALEEREREDHTRLKQLLGRRTPTRR